MINSVLPMEENNLNDNGFLIRNYEGQKKQAQCFPSAERKALYMQNSVSSEIILQQCKKN